MREENLTHSIDPIFDENSKILILGSFPSVKSREVSFFYGNEKNRFWRVIARIYDCENPITIEDKKQLLISNNIALWDVIHSCTLSGSADSTIRDVVPNDFTEILRTANIIKVFTNGNKATSLYKKFVEKMIGINAISLPSTSPANARWTEDMLVETWGRELKK